MLIQDVSIWLQYLRAAKRASVGLRMEIMNPMNYTYIGQINRCLRLAFLAAFLKDEAVRDASGGLEKFQAPSTFEFWSLGFGIWILGFGVFSSDFGIRGFPTESPFLPICFTLFCYSESNCWR